MKREHLILLLLFIIVTGSRLYFAFQTPQFSPEGYAEIRAVKSILHTGLPLAYDELSAGGRHTIVTPVFHYSLAFASLIFPVELVATVLPQIFAALVVIFSYLIAMFMTKSVRTSLLVAFLSGYVPIYFAFTINNVSPYTLALPLMLAAVYYYMRQSITPFLISLLLLSFVSPVTIILILGLIIYLLLTTIEGVNIQRSELEVSVFSIIFTLWIIMLLFKRAFLAYGASIIFQNIPPVVLDQYFLTIQAVEYVAFVGLLPLLFGTAVIYQYLFEKKNAKVYLLSSICLVLFALTFFKLVRPFTGLLFLGVFLTVLSAQYIKDLAIYINQTRVARFKQALFTGLVGLFVLTSIVSSFSFAQQETAKVPSNDLIGALEWIAKNTPSESTVVGSVADGHLITAIANRKSILDSSFLLTPDSRRRLSDLEDIYTSLSEVETVRTLSVYRADYVLIHPNLPYTIAWDHFNSRCFKPAYNSTVIVLQNVCEVEVV